MEKNVLNALWNKTCDVFSTKNQLVTGLATKQDTLIAGLGISITNGVISNAATEETISIVVTTLVSGVSVEGLVINAYYNDSNTVSATVTTDNQGRGTLVVPHDYKYKLIFPDIQGCGSISPIVHTSTLVQRSIEVEYVEVSSTGELVLLTLLQKSSGSYVAALSITVSVTYGGSSTLYTTGSDGKTSFLIPYGTTYTITLPDIQDYYLMPTVKTQSFYANRTIRYITARYDDPLSGLYIVTSDGTEYTPDAWEAAVEGGTRLNSDAKVIKIATSSLVSAGGVFGIDIDMIRNRTYSLSLLWCSSNVKFNSIPENGGSTSALCYYDGLTASKLIQQEGDDRSLATPAVDDCLNRTLTIGGVSHEGFLGSAGQWALLWANVTAIDDILSSVRPNGTSLFGEVVGLKWTSTQGNASSAGSWTSVLDSGNKFGSYIVVPFFAF